MYRREHRDQLSFKDFFLPFGGQLSGENRWIKLSELIPWDELEDDYAAQFDVTPFAGPVILRAGG